MENLIYWCAGFFVGYLLVRGIRTLWSGGFVFLLCSGLSVQGATYWTFQNDTGGAISIGGGGKLVTQKNSASGVGISSEHGADGDIPAGHTFVAGNATSFSPGDTWKVYFQYPGNVTGNPSEIIASGTYSTDFNLTGGPGGEPIYTQTINLSGAPFSAPSYTNYTSIDCVTNHLAVPADIRYNQYIDFSGPIKGPDGQDGIILNPDGEQFRRLQPGEVWCITNAYLVPVTGFFYGNGLEPGNWDTATNSLPEAVENVSTNSLTTNQLGGAGGIVHSPDPFADIPFRDVSSSNANQIVQRGSEGIVKAVGDSGDLIGGKLDKIYGALTNGFGDGGDGTNTASEDLLRMIATNTFAMSNMVVNATNLSGFQGMATGASNTAVALYGGSNSMGGAYQSISNNTASTDLFSPGARAPTASLTIAIGSVGGNDYSINLDPNQTGTWLSEKLVILWDLLSFTKKFAAMVVFIALFWVMYNHVEQYSIHVIQNAGRIAKLPSVGVADLAGRAAFGVFLTQVITVIIGILPWTAFAVMSLYFNTAPASSVPNINVETQAGIDLTGVLKETFLRYFWAMAHGIPFAEMLSAFIQYAAFRFYMPWLFGLVITLIDTYAIMVVGRCILPFLFVVGASGAQIELHNLTGTNLLWTNSTRLIQFPPGETRIDIESGWYLTNGSEVPLPETENIQVLRFSFDPDGALTFDYAFATSPADNFWYGLAAGISIFGTLAFVSVIKAGIGVGTRNNVWVPD